MISSIQWVPAGVSDPNPKKYELSKAELEMLRMMEEQGQQQQQQEQQQRRRRQEEEQQQEDDAGMENDDDDDDDDEEGGGEKKGDELPKDLRMDEYSDDDDDEEQGGARLGRLLVGNDDVNDDDDDENDVQIEADEGIMKEDDDDDDDDDDSDDDDDDDSDDDLADVPDTREFTPVDVGGLEAMGLGLDRAAVAGGGVGVGGGKRRSSKGAKYGEFDDFDYDDDDSDAEQVRLTENDAVVVVAKTEDDFASLEVHAYDRELGNLYVHHDIPLPSYPLCLSHGVVSSYGRPGNYVAVGTFDPAIEIWNLDVINALEPSCVLGGIDAYDDDDAMLSQFRNDKKKKKRGGDHKQQQQRQQRSVQLGGGVGGGAGKGLRPGSHTDAVMSLSWNAIHRQVLASGSADGTVKLWDVTHAVTTTTTTTATTTSRKGREYGGGGDSDDDAYDYSKCNAATMTHHRDKVQCVSWHPSEGTLLATGSFDKTVALVDARNCGSDGTAAGVKRIRIPADCESLAWDPHRPERLTVLSEDGTMTCYDVRQFGGGSGGSIWSFVASEYGGVSDVCYSDAVPGFMASCSVDGTVTLWDAYHDDDDDVFDVSAGRPDDRRRRRPRAVASKDMCSGKLYAASFYPSCPWLLGCGGSGNQLALWDMSGEDSIRDAFASRMDFPHAAGADNDATAAAAPSASTKERDFEAMMTTNEKTKKGGDGEGEGDDHRKKDRDDRDDDVDDENKNTNIKNKNKKKKGKGGKRKVHRRGR